ncbi:hypothetical protein TNCV_4627671 [Trichonephila clavipes]|nr:hypothetical protein TNCV_4627671 [Trichonephila clavipes]
MGRHRGIRLWDDKREILENKSEQEVIMEESSKEGTGQRGDVLPNMMMMMTVPFTNDGRFDGLAGMLNGHHHVLEKVVELCEVHEGNLETPCIPLLPYVLLMIPLLVPMTVANKDQQTS